MVQRAERRGRAARSRVAPREALGCRKIELYTRFDQTPGDDQRAVFRDLVRQAGEHTPIAYLLGRREFFSLDFNVTPAVLIPRPETEVLAQRAIQMCREAQPRVLQILDVGTGSGCIAIAIGKYAANAMLVASDLSPEAAAVAASNVERHGLAERVRVVQADLVCLLKELVPPGGFDLIVSNPPYIPQDAWKELPVHIRDHEPRIALTPGPEGMEIHRRLAAEAPAVLAPGGTLLVEVGSGPTRHNGGEEQSVVLPKLFESTGRWRFLRSHRESTDPHERVLEFERTGE